MADENKLSQDRLLRESAELLESYSSISSRITEINRKLKSSGEASMDVGNALNSVKRVTDGLASTQREYLKSSRGSVKVNKKLEEVQDKVRLLQEKSRIALEKANDAAVKGTEEAEETARLYRAQAENFKYLADEVGRAGQTLSAMRDEAARLDKSTKFFSTASEFAQSIPGLSALSGPFKEAEEAARKTFVKTESSFKAFSAGFSKFANKFAKATFIKGFLDISSNSSDIAKQLNISTTEALKLERSFRNQALQTGKMNLTTKQLIESNRELNNALGTAEVFSANTLTNFTVLTKRFGQSAETAAKLAKLAAVTGQDYTEQTKSLIGQVEVSNALTGVNIDNKKVLEDIGGMNTATLLTLRNQGVQLGKAAADVRRLGLNFQLLESSAQNLLNFESSISNELEAELLTGRELTLERARIAALTGDSVTLAAELARNFGSAEEFTSQNVLAQEAQAKALGMTRDQLANVLLEREALTQMGVRDNDEAKKKINSLIKEKGYQAAIAEYGDNQYARQLANQSIQEKIADTVTRFQSIIVSLVDGPLGGMLTLLEKTLNVVNLIGSGFGKLGSAGDYIYGAIAKTARAMQYFAEVGTQTSGFAMRIANFFTKISSTAKGAFGMISKFGKGLGKIFGLGILKKIPGLGLIIGTLNSINRAMQGDWVGAAMDLTSGIASTIPGLGTAASIGIDVASVARDKYRSNKAESEEKATPQIKEKEVEDFVIKTHPKDTLVMAGGTKLGGDDKKVDRMITLLEQLVTKEGTVYINGNAAGKALALQAYRTS
jgi:hypothetical protein